MGEQQPTIQEESRRANGRDSRLQEGPRGVFRRPAPARGRPLRAVPSRTLEKGREP
jgi:hypothetical protein